MIDFHRKTLLVLSPHPDDEVIGCAGIMQRVREAGGRVYVMHFVAGVTQDFGKRRASQTSERLAEIRRVARELRVTGWRLVFEDGSHHLQLDQVPQKQLIHEIERGEKISLELIRPHLLVIPWMGDYNQDHRAVAQAALAACRPAPQPDKWVPEAILAYESPMNQWGLEGVQPNVFVGMSATQMKKKVRAMGLYTSQVRRATHPRHGESLEALARLRGTMIGKPFAEAFVCHKLVVE